MKECKRGNQNIPANLPQELIANILSRLPIEWILRCKCVCKLWYTVINTDYFVKLQFDFTNKQPSYRVIFEKKSRNSVGISKLFLIDIENDCKCRELPALPIEGQNVMQVESFLHGLICVARFDNPNPVLIYNPLLVGNKYISLPKSDITGSFFRQSVSLGFDSSLSKYKAVRIFKNKNYFTDSNYCEVITIGENSLWRQIVTPREVVINNRYPSGVFHQGSIFWIIDRLRYWGDGNPNSRDRDYVLELDLTSEKFREITFPRSIKTPKCRRHTTDLKFHMQLFVLEGCVALMEYDGYLLHIWRIVKQEDGISRIVRYNSIPIELPYNYACLYSLLCLDGTLDSMFLYINGCFGTGNKNKEVSQKIQFYNYLPRYSKRIDRGLENLTLNLKNISSLFFLSWCFKPSLLTW